MNKITLEIEFEIFKNIYFKAENKEPSEFHELRYCNLCIILKRWNRYFNQLKNKRYFCDDVKHIKNVKCHMSNVRCQMLFELNG